MGGEAFSLVFKTYFKLKGVPKRPQEPDPTSPLASVAGYPQGPMDRPLCDARARERRLPAGPAGRCIPGLRAELTTWQYGEVAEILHVGPYDREESTIRRLMDFIRDSGYVIAGEHEEEYIRAPASFPEAIPRSISRSSGTG